VERIETQVTSRSSPGVTLAVTEHGDRASSTHVVLVHGYPDDQQMWDPVVAALPADWHLITYDVRGSGRSTRPERRTCYRIERLVEDFAAVLDATVPDGAAVHLVAHDWGSIALWDAVADGICGPGLEGRIATYTSCSGPSIDHVASLAAGWRGKLAMAPQSLHSWYVWLFLLPGLAELASRRATGSLRPVLRRIDPTIDLLPPDEELVANAVPSVDLYRANVLQRLRHPRIWSTSVPVQLVVATRDGFVTPRSLAGLEDRCHDLTRVEVDEGHWLPRARPAELADLVVTFVRTHAA
jgi:pimeloyl-ACP methyl ester carboxylesterase